MSNIDDRRKVQQAAQLFSQLLLDTMPGGEKDTTAKGADGKPKKKPRNGGKTGISNLQGGSLSPSGNQNLNINQGQGSGGDPLGVTEPTEEVQQQLLEEAGFTDEEIDQLPEDLKEEVTADGEITGAELGALRRALEEFKSKKGDKKELDTSARGGKKSGENKGAENQPAQSTGGPSGSGGSQGTGNSQPTLQEAVQKLSSQSPQSITPKDFAAAAKAYASATPAEQAEARQALNAKFPGVGGQGLGDVLATVVQSATSEGKTKKLADAAEAALAQWQQTNRG